MDRDIMMRILTIAFTFVLLVRAVMEVASMEVTSMMTSPSLDITNSRYSADDLMELFKDNFQCFFMVS